jgi:GWxTD domain-containing protein
MKIMKQAIYILFLCLFSGIVPSFGQNRHAGVDLDVVSFYRDSGKIKVEVYYSFLQKDIMLKEVETNRWKADISAKVTIFQGDKLIVSRVVSKPFALSGKKADIDKSQMQYISDVVPFLIDNPQNALIQFEINLQDSLGKPYTEKLEKRISVPTKTPLQPTFGGVLLASELTQTDRNDSPFEKSGYFFTVNPSNTFGGDYNKLCLYTELSLPESKVKTNDSITINVIILDPTSRELLRKTQRVGASMAIVPYIAALSIDGLPSDSYYLTITAEQNGAVIAKVQKVFYVESDIILSEEEQGIDGQALDMEALFQSSEISKMGDVDLTNKIAQANYILPDDIRKSLEKSTVLAEKQRMFFDFWIKKDQPMTRPFSSYNDYYGRVDIANHKFSYQKTIGWKTDRGRIFIMYGPPDRTIDELFNTQSKPYIQWQYIGRGYRLSEGSRAFFYFVDKMGGGNFTLVHSNVMGEVSNPNWYTMDALQIR